jgi:NADH-quinone oxidoreductase subunit N
MSVNDLVALLPLIVLGTAIVLLLLVAAFNRSHSVVALMAILGLSLAFASLFVPSASSQVTPLLVMDGYARFFIGLMLAASLVVMLLAYGYLGEHSINPEEFYILLLLATLGAAVLAASSHFASFFLGLEILSISLYALIAYLRTSERSVEAGAKYLVLAGASSAFLLFGMALVYAEAGTMELARLASIPSTATATTNYLLLPGLAMMVVGIGFKLAVVPFHLWTPDVYEGSPAPVTAFVATVSKGAVFALLLRYFTQIDIHAYQSLFIIFVLIALASMLVGNLLALFQNNVKRILAYSSIAHLGYLLVAFLASGPLAVTAVAFYLLSYFITTLGAFGVVTVLSNEERDADDIQDYRGLYRRHPWLAGIMTAMLFSLAGIPLTAGFVGKFILVAAGVSSELWLPVVVLVISSAIGLFYYLRIIVALYAAPEPEREPLVSRSLPVMGSVVLVGLTLLLVWLGIYPTSLIQLIQSTIGRLT